VLRLKATQSQFLHGASCIATTAPRFSSSWQAAHGACVGRKNLHMPVSHYSQLDDRQQDGCLASYKLIIASQASGFSASIIVLGQVTLPLHPEIDFCTYRMHQNSAARCSTVLRTRNAFSARGLPHGPTSCVSVDSVEERGSLADQAAPDEVSSTFGGPHAS
jgi:hypothetical protein